MHMCIILSCVIRLFVRLCQSTYSSHSTLQCMFISTGIHVYIIILMCRMTLSYVWSASHSVWRLSLFQKGINTRIRYIDRRVSIWERVVWPKSVWNAQKRSFSNALMISCGAYYKSDTSHSKCHTQMCHMYVSPDTDVHCNSHAVYLHIAGSQVGANRYGRGTDGL